LAFVHRGRKKQSGNHPRPPPLARAPGCACACPHSLLFSLSLPVQLFLYSVLLPTAVMRSLRHPIWSNSQLLHFHFQAKMKIPRHNFISAEFCRAKADRDSDRHTVTPDRRPPDGHFRVSRLGQHAHRTPARDACCGPPRSNSCGAERGRGGGTVQEVLETVHPVFGNGERARLSSPSKSESVQVHPSLACFF
jgi:hypothetical protein